MKSRINKFPDLKLAKCKDKSSENAIQGISPFEMKTGTTCHMLYQKIIRQQVFEIAIPAGP